MLKVVYKFFWLYITLYYQIHCTDSYHGHYYICYFYKATSLREKSLSVVNIPFRNTANRLKRNWSGSADSLALCLTWDVPGSLAEWNGICLLTSSQLLLPALRVCLLSRLLLMQMGRRYLLSSLCKEMWNKEALSKT